MQLTQMHTLVLDIAVASTCHGSAEHYELQIYCSFAGICQVCLVIFLLLQSGNFMKVERFYCTAIYTS